MPLGDSYKLWGQGSVSDAESREHQASLFAKRTVHLPSDFKVRYDYDGRTDGQPVYIGYAPKASLTSDAVWIVHKFTYDGSDNATERNTQFTSWDSRASGTYN